MLWKQTQIRLNINLYVPFKICEIHRIRTRICIMSTIQHLQAGAKPPFLYCHIYSPIIGWDKDFQAHGKATRSNSAAVCLLFSPLIMEAHEGVEHAQEKV